MPTVSRVLADAYQTNVGWLAVLGGFVLAALAYAFALPLLYLLAAGTVAWGSVAVVGVWRRTAALRDELRRLEVMRLAIGHLLAAHPELVPEWAELRQGDVTAPHDALPADTGL